MKRFAGCAARAVRGFQVGLVLAVATAGTAMADAIDTTSLVASITEASAAVAVVGAAVIAGPKIGVKVWKWLTRAL